MSDFDVVTGPSEPEDPPPAKAEVPAEAPAKARRR
jgi:hypothetical protein